MATAEDRPRVLTEDEPPEHPTALGRSFQAGDNGDPRCDDSGYNDIVPLIMQANLRSDCRFKNSCLPMIYGLLIANLAMVLMVFILPIFCPGNKDLCYVDPFSVLIYTHTLYWIFHLIADQVLKSHHRRGRLLGYLEFYIETKNLRRAPFYIISFANVVLLVTVTAIHDYCYHDGDKDCEIRSTRIDVLRGLISVEVMAISFMWFKYIRAVKSFQKEDRLPDIFRDEFVREITNPEEALSEKPEHLAEAKFNDVIQRQSELLHYICNLVKLRQEAEYRNDRISSQLNQGRPQVEDA